MYDDWFLDRFTADELVLAMIDGAFDDEPEERPTFLQWWEDELWGDGGITVDV